MRLLFSAVCPTGFGETLIGVSLADQLRKLGVTSHFIIEPHALRMLVQAGDPVHGVVFRGRRYDTGDRGDYLRAIVRLACERPDIGPEFRQWLEDFVAGRA